MKNTTGPKPKDIKGERFNNLVAIRYIGKEKWMFLCDCGKETIKTTADVKRGKTKSCGCILTNLRKLGNNRRTHGFAGTREYGSWISMTRRCTNQDDVSYHRYGGRGITICKSWESFENFYNDMGDRPKGMTLDRINNNGNYEPENCKWSTHIEQCGNMSKNTLLSANGKTQCIEVWAREIGVSGNSIRYRLKIGMSEHDSINKPFRANGGRNL